MNDDFCYTISSYRYKLHHQDKKNGKLGVNFLLFQQMFEIDSSLKELYQCNVHIVFPSLKDAKTFTCYLYPNYKNL